MGTLRGRALASELIDPSRRERTLEPPQALEHEADGVAVRKEPVSLPLGVDGRRLAIAVLGAALAGGCASTTRIAVIDALALDRTLATAFERLEVPGAAVAIVHHDEVVFEHTYGVASLDAPQRVTPETLFLTASVTKPMTTLMQAALVDAGVLGWNTRMTTVLPSFALGDPALTAKLELWHMSCACTGMPRRDIENLVEYGALTAEQRVASMREMMPTSGLGELYQYSNLMVMAGGYIAAHAYRPKLALGAAYVEAMRDLVFAPLRMRSSTADFDLALARAHAKPHALDIDGRVRSIDLGFERSVVPIAPAGAVWSTLTDMARYASAELARGAGIVSERTYAERVRRRIGDETSGYALGINVERVDGALVLGHDGGSNGFGTSLYLLPEHGLGLVVLTNVRNGTPDEHLPFNAVAKSELLAFALGRASRSREIIDGALKRRAARTAAMTTGLERAPDAEWRRSIAGTYTSTNAGAIEIRDDMFDVGEWRARFGRKEAAIVLLDPPFAGTAISVENGEITLPDPETKYVFRRAR